MKSKDLQEEIVIEGKVRLFFVVISRKVFFIRCFVA